MFMYSDAHTNRRQGSIFFSLFLTLAGCTGSNANSDSTTELPKSEAPAENAVPTTDPDTCQLVKESRDNARIHYERVIKEKCEKNSDGVPVISNCPAALQFYNDTLLPASIAYSELAGCR